MAVKKAQVVIDVNSKSLEELNSEIKTLETSVSKLAVGTQQWVEANKKLGGLKSQFETATNEAKKLQGAVEKVGSDSMIKSIAKTGSGLVGAFAGFSGTLQLLSDGNKKFEEITAKAATFMQVMGGLNAIAETFSAENLKGLKALGSQFGVLVKTVKTSATSIKSALITTGIGALVVALGTVIAYWDEISAAITGVSDEQEKLLDDTKKTAEVQSEQVDLLSEQENILKLQGLTEKEILQLKIKETDEAIAAQEIYIQNIKISNEAREAAAKRNRELLDGILKFSTGGINIILQGIEGLGKLFGKDWDLATKFNDWVADFIIDPEEVKDEGEKALKEQEKILNKLKNQRAGYQLQINAIDKDAYEKRKKLAEDREQEALQNDLNEIARKKELADLEKRIQLSEADLNIKLKSLEITKQINELENNILNDKSYTNQANLKIWKNIVLTREETIKVVEAYEKWRVSGQGIENSLFKIRDLSFDFNNASVSFVENGKQMSAFFGLSADYMERIKDASELESKIGLKKTQIAAKVLDLSKIAYIYNEKVNQVNEDYNNGLIGREEKQKRLNNLEKQQGEYVDKLVDASREAIGKLQRQQFDRLKILELTKEQYKTELNINQGLRDNAQQRLDEAINQGKSEEDILEIKKEIVDYDKKIYDLNLSINGIKEDQLNLIAESIIQNVKLGEVEKTNAEKRNEWLQKYNKEIQAGMEALNNAFGLIIASQERAAANSQERIDEYQQQLDELNQQEEERANRLLEYEEELKDANGERYDELLTLIDAEKEAQIQAQNDIENNRAAIEAKIKDEENKKLAAEARAAKWRKAQALTDAIIQGALAVVEALPNVVLAAIVGAASAAEVAIIAAQKTPDIPAGYELGGLLKGKSHKQGGIHIEAEGGEYIINRKSTAQFLPVLEAINEQGKKKYANGGMVTPNIQSSSTDIIDYNKMANAFMYAIGQLPNPQVSVLAITNGIREVQVTQQAASI